MDADMCLFAVSPQNCFLNKTLRTTQIFLTYLDTIRQILVITGAVSNVMIGAVDNVVTGAVGSFRYIISQFV